VFPRAELPAPLKGFEILQRLGAGGVGEVFLAKSRGGRLVAIKVLADGRAGDGVGDGFAREASLCARLNHPAIVQVRAFLEEEGFAALVFEYVAGVALARLLRFCASHGVRLPDRAAWHVVERVLVALAHAHAMRDEQQQATPIVHRDVSPSNVLVDWNGGVKLADFGIAKMMGASSATTVGVVKGTLGCMAPEQARGETVTERADVYAAGLLAWRLATGRVPFAKHARDEFELLRAMRNPRIKPLAVLRPDLPEALLAAIANALEVDQDARTMTATKLAEIVRESVDVRGGQVELAELLARWKPALERTVKRAGTDAESTTGRAAHTLRYEEVALAFDEDDVPIDGPTFEAHALPSDAAMLAALPIDADRDIESPISSVNATPSSLPPPPPATLDAIAEITSPAPPAAAATAVHIRRDRRRIVAITVGVVVGVAVAVAILLTGR
jgi:serine/threonine protein kinase